MSVPRTDADPRQGLIDSVDFWWHSIDLGDGLVTPGRKSAAWLKRELAALRALCLAAGFRRVEVKQGAPRKSALHEALRRLHLFASGARTRRPRYYRAIVHAYK